MCCKWYNKFYSHKSIIELIDLEVGLIIGYKSCLWKITLYSKEFSSK